MNTLEQIQEYCQKLGIEYMGYDSSDTGIKIDDISMVILESIKNIVNGNYYGEEFE